MKSRSAHYPNCEDHKSPRDRGRAWDCGPSRLRACLGLRKPSIPSPPRPCLGLRRPSILSQPRACWDCGNPRPGRAWDCGNPASPRNPGVWDCGDPASPRDPGRAKLSTPCKVEPAPASVPTTPTAVKSSGLPALSSPPKHHSMPRVECFSVPDSPPATPKVPEAKPPVSQAPPAAPAAPPATPPAAPPAAPPPKAAATASAAASKVPQEKREVTSEEATEPRPFLLGFAYVFFALRLQACCMKVCLLLNSVCWFLRLSAASSKKALQGSAQLSSLRRCCLHWNTASYEMSMAWRGKGGGKVELLRKWMEDPQISAITAEILYSESYGEFVPQALFEITRCV